MSRSLCGYRWVSNTGMHRRRSYLIIALLTTARTTAFIPALSPPDVSTASFIFCALDMVRWKGSSSGYMRLYRPAEIV